MICCGKTILTERCHKCGKRRPRKEYEGLSIGDRLKIWDNSADNTVHFFNVLFEEVQGGDQDDLLIIREPYTHGGRIITRVFRDGKERTFPFLFGDETVTVAGSDSLIVFDTWCRKTGAFLHTYRQSKTIARDYGVDRGTANIWIKDGKGPIKITRRSLCLE